MADYIRARSEEQKEERLAHIKVATAELFRSKPYQEITLSTIAEKLGWSRANLYKYVTTKEEIFLEIASDKMNSYYSALTNAFSKESVLTLDEIASTWAAIANQHQDYMRYVSYLNPIIETNVTVERLALFKKKYYDKAYELCDNLSRMLSISKETAYRLQLDVLFYASSHVISCYHNPLVQEALKTIRITPPAMNFENDLQEFLLMRIAWLQR